MTSARQSSPVLPKVYDSPTDWTPETWRARPAAQQP